MRHIHCGKFLLPRKVGQSSPNSGSKCRLARPLTVPNFVTLWQEVCEIPTVENLCSPKKCIKISQIEDLLHTNAPHHAKFHRARPIWVQERVTIFFLLPSVFWHSMGPPGPKLSHQSWPWCTARPPLSNCQISPQSENPSTRYLLRNTIDFYEGVTHTHATVTSWKRRQYKAWRTI